MSKKGVYLSEEFGFNASMKTAKKPVKQEVKKAVKTTNTNKKK